MDITKTRLYDFIDRCKKKAVGSVNIKFETALYEAVVKYLHQPENDFLRVNINAVDKAAADIEVAIGNIREMLDGEKWKTVKWASRPVTYGTSDMGKHLFANYVPVGSAVEEVRNEWATELERVENSYSALNRYVQQHTPSKRYKYLVELGFDVSWLHKEQFKPVNNSIDPSALFVCGEKGA